MKTKEQVTALCREATLAAPHMREAVTVLAAIYWVYDGEIGIHLTDQQHASLRAMTRVFDAMVNDPAPGKRPAMEFTRS